MKRDKRNGGEMVEKKRKGDDKRKNVEKKVWSYSNRICMEMGYDHQVFLPTIQNIHILPFYSFFFLLHVHDALNLATFRKMLSSIFYEILAVLFPHDSLIHRTALQWHLALDNRSVQKRKRL